jgi:cytochrome P450
MSLADKVDIFNPDAYVHGPPHTLFAELRHRAPVFWQQRSDAVGEPGYWAILKYADVVEVSRRPEVFSASEGGVTLDTVEAGAENAGKMLISMDPPVHGQHRRPLADHFKRATIAKLEGRIRDCSRAILGDAAARCDERGQVEFVQDVCTRLPSQVIGELMGLPRHDWNRMHLLTEEMTRNQDPDTAQEAADPQALAAKASGEMLAYASEFAARRRSEPPRPDLTTYILDADFGGKRLNDNEYASLFLQLVVAGNDTTVSMLSSGLHLLLHHGDQLAELRADPSLIPGAVEEMLRYANPVHYIARTAVADTELRGVPIKSGQRLAMYYTSANRDEEVFADPHRFDVHRSPNPHLAFGIGEHFCLGAQLARLEGKVFFQELLTQFPTLQLAGEPKWLRSNMINGFKELPVFLGR